MNDPDEHSPEKINSISQGLWWSLVTMATVSYGDKIPLSIPGKFLAALAAVSGVMIIAIPVAILGKIFKSHINSQLKTIYSSKLNKKP